MTLLEVLLAVVIMVLMATTITTAISAIVAMERRSRMTVAGYELASRLMLQHLDTFLDKSTPMPDKSLPLEHNGDLFFWDMTIDRVRMQVNATQEGGSLQGLNRFQLATITIFEAEGDCSNPTRGEPIATLGRLYDPATARNPDTIARFGADAIGEMLRSIFGDAIQVPQGGLGPATTPGSGSGSGSGGLTGPGSGGSR
jgi:hypothetical protein